MPGAIIEDNVVLGAKSLVLKDQVLTTGKMYAGIPAHEIKPDEQGN
jgi:carbonic anhydrase/acetyltransferase-like protein (isoleucine patch superfamily)